MSVEMERQLCGCMYNWRRRRGFL